jgi:hypothetical protein
MSFCKAMTVLVLFGGSASIGAQIRSTDNSINPGSQPSISLILSASSPQIKLGDQIRLNISLTNTSGKEILVGDERGGVEVDYDISIADENGKAPAATAYLRSIKGNRLPDDPKFYRTYSRQILSVKPGMSLDNRIDLGRIYKIISPGIYKIRVERLEEISKKRVQSNTITLTVIP